MKQASGVLAEQRLHSILNILFYNLKPVKARLFVLFSSGVLAA